MTIKDIYLSSNIILTSEMQLLLFFCHKLLLSFLELEQMRNAPSDPLKCHKPVLGWGSLLEHQIQ